MILNEIISGDYLSISEIFENKPLGKLTALYFLWIFGNHDFLASAIFITSISFRNSCIDWRYKNPSVKSGLSTSKMESKIKWLWELGFEINIINEINTLIKIINLWFDEKSYISNLSETNSKYFVKYPCTNFHPFFSLLSNFLLH